MTLTQKMTCDKCLAIPSYPNQNYCKIGIRVLADGKSYKPHYEFKCMKPKTPKDFKHLIDSIG